MKYSVNEVFLTVQGEGANTGRKAVFVRFAGCNMWDGNPDHREKGKGACAKWCFAPETPVLMADWSWRAIGDLRPGDMVMAANAPGDLGLRPAKVLAQHRRTASLARIKTSHGEVIGTADHRFWERRKKEAGRWTPAKDMVGGRTVALAESPPRWDAAEWRRGWMAGVAFGDGCFWTLRKSGKVRAVPYDRDADWVTRTHEYRRFRLTMRDADVLTSFETWAHDAGFDVRPGVHNASASLGADDQLDALWITQSDVAAAFEEWLDGGEGAAYSAGFLAGTCDAEGHVRPRTVMLAQSAAANPVNYARIKAALSELCIEASEVAGGFSLHGMARWKFMSWCRPVLSRKRVNSGVSLVHSVGAINAVEPLDTEGEVVTLTTEAGCYFAGGLLAKNCDTDFFKGRKVDKEELAQTMKLAWGPIGVDPPFAVLTGGEPAMQVDDALIWHLSGWDLAIETNGTIEVPGDHDNLVCVTVSPKLRNDRKPPKLADLERVDELKVILPGSTIVGHGWTDNELRELASWAEDRGCEHFYVQPMDPIDPTRVDVSLLRRNYDRGNARLRGLLNASWKFNVERCKDFVMENPRWRINSQTHKMLNLP